MHTTAKRILALWGMAVMLVLVASITAIPAFAANHGIYIATARPSYKNPSTGVIEDSGGESSQALGQAMTESATGKKALVEVDKDGNVYVTLRLNLMDNITNPRFQVDGAPVSATCMQENFSANTADYRMRVNSENSVIRCSLNVAAMGRDVIYFVTLSNLQPGSGDFITSIEAVPPETEAPTQPKPTEPKPTEPKPTTPQPTAPEATEPNDTEPSATEAPTETPTAAPAEDFTEPEETRKPAEALGLQEFDASGNLVEETKPAAQKQGSSMGTFLWVILGAAAVGGVGFCVWYFGFFKKK